MAVLTGVPSGLILTYIKLGCNLKESNASSEPSPHAWG